MKKYVKPELFFEQFELNTHIANCVWEHNDTLTSAADICSFTADNDSDWAGAVVFVGGNEKCNTEMDEGMLCYYTGSDGMNTFNS